MIRFIINTTISSRDTSGNCYHYDTVTATKTGRSLTINAGWGSDGGNTKALLRNAGLDWSEIHYAERVIGKSDFRRALASMTEAVHEHEIDVDAIFALEKDESKPDYCKPWNAGLCSETRAVARTIGKAFDAMSEIDSNIAQGDIVEDFRAARMLIQERLERDGWTVSCVNGSLEGTNKINVYPPDSPTGKKIRKWREER